MIAGFETKSLLKAQISALEREARSHSYGSRHAEEIQRQLGIFKKALAELERTGEPVVEKRRGRASTVRNSTTGRTYQEWVN